MNLFAAIANMPARENPHWSRDDYLYHDGPKKHDDDIFAVYEDENGDQVTEIPGTTGIAADLIEGGYCKMTDDGQELVADMEEYHATRHALYASGSPGEYVDDGYYDDDDGYEDGDYYDEDDQEGIPLMTLQVGLKNHEKLPWTTPKEYYEHMHLEARQYKAQVIHGNLECFAEITLRRQDLCYNMMCQDRYFSESDSGKTRFWWIPQRHPIGQLLITTEKNMRQDEGIETDEDDEFFHWWSCYGAFDEDTGNVVVFEDEAVQRALDFIIDKCTKYGLHVDNRARTTTSVVVVDPSPQNVGGTGAILHHAASSHRSSIMTPVDDQSAAISNGPFIPAARQPVPDSNTDKYPPRICASTEPVYVSIPKPAPPVVNGTHTTTTPHVAEKKAD